MDENNTSRLLESTEQPRKFKARRSDLAIFAVLIIVIAAFAVTLTHYLTTRREVTGADTLSHKVISALAAQNTVHLRALGDKTFQANNSAATLSNELTFKTVPPITFGALYGKTKPSVDQQFVVNNTRGQHVVTIYSYGSLKVPFFVRVDAIKPPSGNQWYLQALSASSDESTLVGG